MKIALFLMGNAWLLIALVLLIGKTIASETTYSIFNLKNCHFSSSEYNLMLVVCIFLCIMHFLSAFRSHQKQ